jgi:hypothetical protein
MGGDDDVVVRVRSDDGLGPIDRRGACPQFQGQRHPLPSTRGERRERVVDLSRFEFAVRRRESGDREVTVEATVEVTVDRGGVAYGILRVRGGTPTPPTGRSRVMVADGDRKGIPAASSGFSPEAALTYWSWAGES